MKSINMFTPMQVLRTSLILTCLSLFSLSTFASHIPTFVFFGEDFTFDATAYGAGASFTARNMNFNYDSEVDQFATATPDINDFDQTGIVNFSAFFPLFGAPIGAGVSGLGFTYNMYATFSAIGTTDFNGGPSTSINGDYTAFSFELWIDAAMNTSFTSPATNGAADESMAVTGFSGDDVSILSATLSLHGGGFHVFSGLAAGDFDVLLDVNAYDPSIFGGLAFDTAGGVQADFNGVISTITGVSAGDFIDATLQGSGNATFKNVPEPSSLALLAIALFGLSFTARRTTYL
jgi:hypothetical protein